jgi:hypothetical protein
VVVARLPLADALDAAERRGVELLQTLAVIAPRRKRRWLVATRRLCARRRDHGQPLQRQYQALSVRQAQKPSP